MKYVRENIIDAEFIIAVVTGANPNVMLELGMSMAAKKKLIILIYQNEDIPFDLNGVSLLNYNPKDLESMAVILKERLKNLKKIQKNATCFLN